MNLKNFDFDKYKRHPRVLEIRFILLFNLVEKEYGYGQALKLFESICNAFNCNTVFLRSIINNRYLIQKGKRNFRMWRQEVIFTLACYKQYINKSARDLLDVSPATLYMQPEVYSLKNFLTDEWLLKLDERVTTCGQPAYRTEVLRFLEAIEIFADTLKRWVGEI